VVAVRDNDRKGSVAGDALEVSLQIIGPHNADAVTMISTIRHQRRKEADGGGRWSNPADDHIRHIRFHGFPENIHIGAVRKIHPKGRASQLIGKGRVGNGDGIGVQHSHAAE